MRQKFKKSLSHILKVFTEIEIILRKKENKLGYCNLLVGKTLANILISNKNKL